MPTIIAAIHGILTNQTDPSWPDKLDAWLFRRDPSIKVLKKEYRAGPFPRWNSLVKDPRLAHSLANELELFLPSSPRPSPLTPRPSIWFVAHSNGAVIALLTARLLIARGHAISGMILTGAAIEPDILKNHLFDWTASRALGTAFAYSSPDDHVLAGPHILPRAIWRGLIRPYGCLGQTGWLCNGLPLATPTISGHRPTLRTRFFPGGHSTYFAPANIRRTFNQIQHDIVFHTPLHASRPPSVWVSPKTEHQEIKTKNTKGKMTSTSSPATSANATTPAGTNPNAPSGIELRINYSPKATMLPGDSGNKSYANVPYFVALCINALLHIPAPK